MKTEDESIFIADGAKIRGNVKLGHDCGIWFNSVIRCEGSESVEIGDRSNLQDNSTVHVAFGYGVKIGKNVTVGHNAVIHGCTVEDNVLIGMGAIVMNGAVIGTGSIVGAGALVTEHTVIPPGSLVVGVPAKVKRALTPEEIENIPKSAEMYVKLKDAYLEGKY